MSEPNIEPAATQEIGTAVPENPVAPRYRRIAIGLAAVLLLGFVSVAIAPFWVPLLPWAPAPVPVSTDAAPADRVAPAQAEDQPAHRKLPSQSQQETPQQRPPQETAATAALQALDRRIGALEARPAAPASDIAEIRQQIARLAGTAADLDTRIAAIGTAAPAPAAADTTDMALVLVLLQIRGAIEVGRPFAAENEALAALTQARPEIAAAAAPLAEPAKTGLASRPVLANRLRELAGTVSAPKAPASAPAKTPTEAPANAGETAPDWADQALTRLRGLVTIRRIDGGGEVGLGGSPDTARDAAAANDTAPIAATLSAAERALAGGDLEGAIGTLGKLTGAATEAASPWLRMAKQRLAVETALHRIEVLLVARLGANPAAPPAAAPTTPGGPGSPR